MEQVDRLRLASLLWLAGMAGAVALSLTVLPELLSTVPKAPPQWLVITASLGQTAVLLALAVWGGTALGPKLGLSAPTLEAVLGRGRPWASLGRQLIPSAVGGLLAAAVLWWLARIAPAELAVLATKIEIPMVAKVLYGGITEELLMRWGLMTTVLWLQWRFFQNAEGAPRIPYVASSVVVAALLFGLLHLPAVHAMGVPLDMHLVGYVVIGNAVPGVLFGYLFWRHGVEAAFIAHAAAHLLAAAAGV